MQFFRQVVVHETKRDGTPVSEVDRLAEALIVEALSSERPGDRVLAEESGEHGPPESNRRWIIDPLDMTEAFLRGEPGWGVHVTLEVEGELELAVITRPVSDLCWWAVRGKGAYRTSGADPLDTSSPLRVSNCISIDEANIGGFARDDSRSKEALAERAIWNDDRFCIVGAMAEGRLDAFIDDGGKPWDQAPAALVVCEAGGEFFDPEGGTRIDRGWGLYTNGLLSDELRQILATT